MTVIGYEPGTGKPIEDGKKSPTPFEIERQRIIATTKEAALHIKTDTIPGGAYLTADGDYVDANGDALTDEAIAAHEAMLAERGS